MPASLSPPQGGNGAALHQPEEASSAARLFEVVAQHPGMALAAVALLEVVLAGVLPRQEAAAERRVRHDADAQLPARRDQVLLRSIARCKSPRWSS